MIYRSEQNLRGPENVERFLVRTSDVVSFIDAADFNIAKKKWKEAFGGCDVDGGVLSLRHENVFSQNSHGQERLEEFEKEYESMEVTLEEMHFRIDVNAIRTVIDEK